MTDRERLIAVLTTCLVQYAVRKADEQKAPAIHPTLRPDPQTASITHGTLMSHANA